MDSNPDPFELVLREARLRSPLEVYPLPEPMPEFDRTDNLVTPESPKPGMEDVPAYQDTFFYYDADGFIMETIHSNGKRYRYNKNTREWSILS